MSAPAHERAINTLRTTLREENIGNVQQGAARPGLDFGFNNAAVVQVAFDADNKLIWWSTDNTRWNGSAAEWSQDRFAATTATRTTTGSPTPDNNYIWLVVFVNPGWTRASAGLMRR